MPTPSPTSMPSIGAKSATVMTWPSSTMPAYAVPTLTRAVAMGSRLAASEPNATKRTTAATTTPTISLTCPVDASVRATALPPSSTWSSAVSASLAVSTTALACRSRASSACASKVTVA